MSKYKAVTWEQFNHTCGINPGCIEDGTLVCEEAKCDRWHALPDAFTVDDLDAALGRVAVQPKPPAFTPEQMGGIPGDSVANVLESVRRTIATISGLSKDVRDMQFGKDTTDE